MVRTYANKGIVKPIDFGKLFGAVKMVKVEKKSERAAAASYQLNQKTHPAKKIETFV